MTSTDGVQRGHMQSRKKSAVVAEHIVGVIVAGGMQAGDRLPPEADMSASYGVGRSTIRERH